MIMLSCKSDKWKGVFQNQSGHEESLLKSLHWLESPNFEDKISIKGVEM